MFVKKIFTDVCIAGAGPAGATTSITLSKLSIPHVIVDTSEFPRDKICGDGLDLKVVRVLNQIDPSIVKNELSSQQDFVQSMGMRFILPNGKNIDLLCNNKNGNTLFNQPIFYVSKRTKFDNFLLNKIDKNFSDLRLGLRIYKIEKENNQWKLFGKTASNEIEINTKILVAADGDQSIVLKYVGDKKINRSHYAAAVRQYWRGVQDIHPQKLIELYFPAKHPFAYFWIFPLNNNEANVGYGMASYYVAKKNINVREALADLIKNDIYLAPRFKNAQPLEQPKGWGIPMSSLHRKAHGDGWLLVGDAASLVCPNSGEGIGTGMLSGYIAAHFIQRAIKKNSFSKNMFTNYDREIHKGILQEERLYKFANAMPAFLFTKALNTIFSSNFFQRWYKEKELKRWLVTAYQKPIKINFD
ncbi:MAG: NAD(P)/FAD-dependent oxidoreductase [Chitinophagaceae bacterium]